MSITPILRLLIYLIIGIIMAMLSSVTFPIWIILLAICFLTATAVILIKQQHKTAFSAAAAACFVSIGYIITILHTEHLYKNHISKHSDADFIIATVNEPLQEKENSYKTILKVEAINKNGKTQKAKGQLLCYLQKDNIETVPAYKDKIIFRAKTSDISYPGNPGSFNYKRYMAFQNVYQQVYIKHTEWKKLTPASQWNIYKKANDIRDKFLLILQQSGMQGKEYAISAALLFGQRDKLDAETLQTYANAGVIHIISVSGMHVGIIYIMLMFMLSFIGNGKRQSIFKTFLVLLTIWAYALLTGLSPAVLRASVMFSFISIGSLTRRDAHIINSVAISAFVILLFNPFLIADVGFQLSYMAVIGIVLIQKPLSDLWQPKYKVTSWLWELVCVSIAAQIATLPLSLLYFHQFPLYFIPSNLIAVPLSSVIIYSALATLVTSFLVPVAKIFAVITSKSIAIMNMGLDFLNDLPASLLHVNTIFVKEAVLLALIIISAYLFFKYKKNGYVFASLCLILLLFISTGITRIARNNQQKLVVYNINKHSAIGIINQTKQWIISDSATTKSQRLQAFNINGTQNIFGIKSIDYKTLNAPNDTVIQLSSDMAVFSDYILINKTRIALANEKIEENNVHAGKPDIDYLIIRYPLQYNNVEALCNAYNPKHIIIDASIPFYMEKAIKDKCQSLGIGIYTTRQYGALTIDF